MGNVIYVLVYAKDEEGALDAVSEVEQEKLGYRQRVGQFVYYIDSTKAGVGLFGNDEWVPIPPILQVSTALFPTDNKRGLDMVNSLMEENRKTFKETMAHIRHCVANYTDDELFGKIDIEGGSTCYDPDSFRLWCGVASGYHAYLDSLLYDFKGNAVWNPEHLQCLLNPSYSNLWFLDESNGKDPNWGEHIWTQPLWIVPLSSITD